ncbi:hypothetical protein FKP32DRAFT_1563335 [Trametes sanguinea]|nr:hypothetical protein FKP32DRAFT_1563335 [Trametes sanguinea]
MHPSDKKLQDYLDQHEERVARWKTLLKTDPRRVVRVLTSTGWATETIDGDTAWDAPYIIEHLKDASLRPQSAVWKGLVDAGVFAALCKCATTFRPAYMAGSNAPVPTEEEKAAHNKEMASPWYMPLAIICTAAVNCAAPPTHSEHRMIEDLKQNWSPIVQRIWSEPANSLEPDDDAAIERAVVGQIVVRLSSLDPTFLETVLKPTDLTLAVCFRNWTHATKRDDTVINNTVILTLLQPDLPSPWERYLAEHPPPSPSHLLPRVILGASKKAGAQKKRTPAQVADSIASSSAKHLASPRMPLSGALQEITLLREFWSIARREFVPFARAVAKCGQLWTALAQIVRRAARATDSYDRKAVTRALMFYTDMSFYVSGDGTDFADDMIFNWVSGGLFDALDESVECILHHEDGPKLLTLIATTIDGTFSALSERTRAVLRSQLPRTGMLWKIFKASLASGDNNSAEQYAESHAALGRGAVPDGRNPVWRQGAWEMFGVIAAKARGADRCARRACDKKAEGVHCATKACKRTRYCSQACRRQ